jgi:5-formyltetrahydrofolate cyclo-ligase
LRSMTAAQRMEGSARARSLLEAQGAWSEAKSVLVYAPLREELDVWQLAEKGFLAGKVVGLPRFDPELKSYAACQIQNIDLDVRPGQFGIREAGEHCRELSLNRLDLILVPGLAFDPQGRRLGRGKGYYDQLLAAVRGITCGVAFDEQIEPEIPVEPHDVFVDCILTPTRWISCSRRAVME